MNWWRRPVLTARRRCAFPHTRVAAVKTNRGVIRHHLYLRTHQAFVAAVDITDVNLGTAVWVSRMIAGARYHAMGTVMAAMLLTGFPGRTVYSHATGVCAV